MIVVDRCLWMGDCGFCGLDESTLAMKELCHLLVLIPFITHKVCTILISNVKEIVSLCPGSGRCL